MRQRLGREWLDEDAGSAEAVRTSLADLAWIHHRLGGEAALRRLLAAALPRLAPNANVAAAPGPGPLRILDVGSGAGAGTAAMLEWLQGQGYACHLVALDRRPSHLLAGRPWPPEVDLAAGDVLALPFPPRSFDLVLCSLFLHHFHGAAAIEVLRAMARLSRGAVLVQDLARSWWGYCGFSLVAAVLLSRMTLHDGRVSFRQAYTAPELAALARAAGCMDYQVSVPGRFRLGLTIWPHGESNGA